MKRAGSGRSSSLARSALPSARGGWIPWAVALSAAVAPLWAARYLPFVDLPQHLYVVDVLKRLHDPATVYPHFFELRPGLKTYVGYYDVVRALGQFLPLDLANRLVLTACVAGLPLSLAFLLRSLRRPAWAALLAIPFAYGDNLAWGFFNFCGALPLAFLSMGLFVRALTDARRRTLWAGLLAVSVAVGFALHPAPAGYLALTVAFLFVTTRVPEDQVAVSLPRRLKARLPALSALLPVLLLGLAWLHRLAPAPGASRVSAFAIQNYQVQPFGQNLGNFRWLLADIMQDGSDRWGLYAVATIALMAVCAWALGLRETGQRQEPWQERVRPFGILAAAMSLYLVLPLNIPGFIWYLNPRFAQVAAAAATGLVPRLGERPARAFTWVAMLGALLTAWPLVHGFRAFDREARSLSVLARAAGERPVIMGLMFDNHSRVVAHPVYLHAAAVIARERGGIPNYTFASLSIVPVQYRTAPPPDYADEWNPALFDYDVQGPAYDHFLLRGAPPESVFTKQLGRELYVAARSGDFWLIRRRRPDPGPVRVAPAPPGSDSSRASPRPAPH